MKLFVLLCFVFTIKADDGDDVALLKKRMEEEQIIPDIIPNAPKSRLNIAFPSGKVVSLGKELTPTEVKDQPTVTWNSDPNKYYTLIMDDPDAPGREDHSWSEAKHWLVVNILGNDLCSGDIIAEFVSSGPPKGSGLHRYIFLVFEQKSRMEFDEPKSGKFSVANRLHWSMQKFIDKYELGEPWAGEFYLTQYDEYVDELNKKLTN